jgi:spore maturation protein CgeB
MNIVILGLSITSAWGNGHATTYRALVRALQQRRHNVTFLERIAPWYAENRDAGFRDHCITELYSSLQDMRARFSSIVRNADLVIVGSYVPEGIAVGEWAIETARGKVMFYDIDTPVTMTRLDAGGCEYINTELIAQYDAYLSFTGGPTLRMIEQRYGSPMARPLYCSVDPSLYFTELRKPQYDLGYMGTYSADRQPGLDRLLIQPAQQLPTLKFVVAGPQYPDQIQWPANVRRIEHMPPAAHRSFYNAQRYTLNLTRADMICAGYSPSVRLFEAAACGTPIISDYWEGLDSFFRPGDEIIIAREAGDVARCLRDMSEPARLMLGTRAQERVLAHHTAAHRAHELELIFEEAVTQNKPIVAINNPT